MGEKIHQLRFSFFFLPVLHKVSLSTSCIVIPPVHLERYSSSKYNHHPFSCAIKEKPTGFELQEPVKLCNIYKIILTCHCSANRTWDQCFVLSRFPQEKGKDRRPGELYWWRQHPAPTCFLSPGLVIRFHLQKGQGQPEHHAPSSRAIGPYLTPYLTVVVCSYVKAALLSHWKRYDPVNQKSLDIAHLLDKWKSWNQISCIPGPAATRLHAVLTEWDSAA